MYHEYTGERVIIMACSDCNTKCKHCYISYKGNFTGEDLFQTACALMESGYSVSINGTEPLIHKEYLKTYELIGQKRALTNGLVFKDNFEYLDEINVHGISALNISYHFDLHNQISSVPKSYLDILWREILSRGMKFTINCTISTSNMYRIPQYCKEALSLGAFRIRFTNLLNQGTAHYLENDLLLSDSQIDYVLDSINNARKLFSKDDLYIERCGSFGANSRTKNFYCPAGMDRVFLTPNRKVYSCVFMTQPGYEIGFYKDRKIYISVC